MTDVVQSPVMVAETELPDPQRPDYCARCGAKLVRREHGGRARPHCPACGWTYFAKPALGAAVLIELDGRLVLVQRRHEPFQGWWMLPAGFVEYGEPAWDTAVREAEEETGLRVELAGLAGVYYGADDPRGVSHLAVYRARVVSGCLAAADDAAAVATFPADGLPERIAFEAHRAAIADWARSKTEA